MFPNSLSLFFFSRRDNFEANYILDRTRKEIRIDDEDARKLVELHTDAI